MGQEFSGNCDVASRNALLYNGATNATRSRRSDSEEAPPCRTRVLGAELDGLLATLNFRESLQREVRKNNLLRARGPIRRTLLIEHGDDLPSEAPDRLLIVGLPRDRDDEVVDARVDHRLEPLPYHLWGTHYSGDQKS